MPPSFRSIDVVYVILTIVNKTLKRLGTIGAVARQDEHIFRRVSGHTAVNEFSNPNAFLDGSGLCQQIGILVLQPGNLGGEGLQKVLWLCSDKTVGTVRICCDEGYVSSASVLI